MTMWASAVEPMLETPEKRSTTEEPLEMFTDPDMYRLIAKQRQADLIAEAKRDQLARSARRGRRGRSPDDQRTAQ